MSNLYEFIVDAQNLASEKLQEINSDLKYMTKQLKATMSDFDGMVTQSNRVAVGIGIMGGALVATGLKAVQGYGQFQMYEATLTTMLGSVDAAKERLRELGDIAANTPFELPDVVELGNQLQAIGKYTRENVVLLGDLAAASGKPIQQVSSAYAKLATGQKGMAVDMFRDLLITTDDWVKATGKGVTKTGELMATTEEMLAVLPQIMEDKKFSGMMEEQSKTIFGAFSNMMDGVGNILRNTGALIDTSMEAIFGTSISEALTGVSEMLGEIGKMVEVFQMTLDGASFEDFSKRFGDDVANVLTKFEEMKVTFQGLLPLFASLAGALGGVLTPGFMNLANNLTKINPTLILLGAAGAALAYAWTTDFGGMRTTLTEWWEASQPFLETARVWLTQNIPLAMEYLKTAWTNAWGVIGPILMTTWGVIQSVFHQVVEWLGPKIGEAIEQFKQYWSEIQPYIVPALTNILTAIQVFGQAIWAFLEPIITEVTSFFRDNWEEIKTIFNAAFTIITTVTRVQLELIKGVIKGALQLISGDFKGVWETIKSTIGNVLNQIWKTIKAVWDGIVATITIVLKRIWKEIVTQWENIKSALNQRMSDIRTLFENGWGKIITFLGDTWNNITKGVSDGAKTVIEAAGKMIDDVKEMFTKLPAQALQWGKDVAVGFANGISNMAGAASAAVFNMVSGANITAEKTAEINSPSKVTTRLGQFYAEGFAVGIKNMAPKVYENTEEMISTLSDQFGSDGEIMKMLNEWKKDKTIGEKFAQIASEIKEKMKVAQEAIDGLGETYKDMTSDLARDFAVFNNEHGYTMAAFRKQLTDLTKQLQDTENEGAQSLINLSKSFQDNIDDISRKITELTNQIPELQAKLSLDLSSIDMSDAQAAVNQEKRIADLQKQIADKSADTKSSGDVAALQTQLQQEIAALEAFKSSAIGLEDEIAEVRRRNGLTDFERTIEDNLKRRESLQLEFDEKKRLIDAEIVAQQEKRTAEGLMYQQKMGELQTEINVKRQKIIDEMNETQTSALKEQAIYEEKRRMYQETLDSFVSMKNDYMAGLSSMADDTVEKVNIIKAKLAEISSNGRDVTELGVRELRGQNLESFARSANLPTTQTSNSSQAFNFNINITGGESVDKQSLIEQMKQELTRAIQLANQGLPA